MASKPETSYIAKVHRQLPKIDDTIFAFEKMSSPFHKGTPDYFYDGPNRSLWVEYKCLRNTPHKRFKPDLSEHQIHWARRRHQNGFNLWPESRVVGQYIGQEFFDRE